jgi:hypothetical protein
MLHADFDGVTYLSMPSAGGHLRASMKYEDGWFFAHTAVTVSGGEVKFQIEEIKPEGRVTGIADWGASGLHHR